MTQNVLILGAAGKDFFVFQRLFKNNKEFTVKGFTATQIPGISGRIFPRELAGRLYPKGIQIYEEKNLEALIKKLKIDLAVFAYSDVMHEHVMHLASRVNASGAGFLLPGTKELMIESRKKVIAVTAVRTGSGKSPLTRRVVSLLKQAGKRVVVLRHPMPYGNLAKQAVQRFESKRDLVKHECTIEEREEFEPLIEKGIVVYAGVDYEKILKKAEKEAEVIVWDGGNNDIPFIKPDLWLCVADPLRQGHEISYYPGEINFRKADAIIISKVNSAKKSQIQKLVENARKLSPKARIIKTVSEIIAEHPEKIKNKKVLVIEDGPTLTHGNLAFGAGYILAKKMKAKIISPKPFAVGSIKQAFEKYPQIKKILPALGYSRQQLKELETTINKAKVDYVVIATPARLNEFIEIKKPWIKVGYEIAEKGNALKKLLKEKGI